MAMPIGPQSVPITLLSLPPMTLRKVRSEGAASPFSGGAGCHRKALHKPRTDRTRACARYMRAADDIDPVADGKVRRQSSEALGGGRQRVNRFANIRKLRGQ